MCSNFECGTLTCTSETCEIRLCDTVIPSNNSDMCNGQTCRCSQENGKEKYACNRSPCQNGGTCSTTFSANIQVCFIINIEKILCFFISKVVLY